MVLGTLAHRALLWPFTEPAYGPRLWRMKNSDVFAEIVQRNVLVLTRAFRARQSPAPGEPISADLFAALVDRTGGATSQTAEQFIGLTGPERGWVLQKLPVACAEAASALSDDFRIHDYVSVRSEVPTQNLDWEPPAPGEPWLQQRIDMVGLTRDGVLEIIELKFTGRVGYHDANDFPQVRAQLAAVRARLGDGGRPMRGRLLYVYAEGGRHSWVTFADERT